MTRQSLARRALRAALETRRRANVDKADPICVFDLAERLGVEVSFSPGNSFGGGYARASRTILVPALRPPGRQAFTCAHELGHWYFEHGNRLEVLAEGDVGGDDDPDEQLANLYAAYLLMPTWVVGRALAERGLVADQLTPVEAYAIACQLGVGFETLIWHLRSSLRLLSRGRADELMGTTPKQLRRDVLGDDRLRHMVIVDAAWRTVAIDLQVGDVAVVAQQVEVDGACAGITGGVALGSVIEGHQPGVALLHSADGSWASSVRVRRKNFRGRSAYRHMEDPDVDELS